VESLVLSDGGGSVRGGSLVDEAVQVRSRILGPFGQGLFGACHDVDSLFGVRLSLDLRVGAAFDDRDPRYLTPDEAVLVFDPDRRLVVTRHVSEGEFLRECGDVHVTGGRVVVVRCELDPDLLFDRAERTAESADRPERSRPRVTLLELPGRVDQLVLDRDGPESFALARDDVLDAVQDVPVAVVRQHPVGPQGDVTDDGNLGVQQQLQPVQRLLQSRTPLEPDHAVVVALVEMSLDRVCSLREVGGRGEPRVLWRLVGEVVLAQAFALCRVPTRGKRADELVVGLLPQQVPGPVFPTAEDGAVDLLEDPGGVRVERLSGRLDLRVGPVARLEGSALLGPVLAACNAAAGTGRPPGRV